MNNTFSHLKIDIDINDHDGFGIRNIGLTYFMRMRLKIIAVFENCMKQ